MFMTSQTLENNNGMTWCCKIVNDIINACKTAWEFNYSLYLMQVHQAIMIFLSKTQNCFNQLIIVCIILVACVVNTWPCLCNPYLIGLSATTHGPPCRWRYHFQTRSVQIGELAAAFGSYWCSLLQCWLVQQ